MMTNRDEVFQLIRKKLLKAQASMKNQADMRHCDVNCHLGEWVLLKLHPHRQSTAKGSQAFSGKLAKRFYGPFLIIERIGKVAYHLKLPPEARIHSIFHCSMLKPFHGDPEDAPITLPDQIINHKPIIAPMAILDYRRTKPPPNATWEVLVQWQGLSPGDTSWEDWSQLRQEYLPP